MLGDQAGASVLHERSLELHRELGDSDGIAFAANNLANAAVLSGDYATARRLYQTVVDWATARSTTPVSPPSVKRATDGERRSHWTAWASCSHGRTCTTRPISSISWPWR